jgi:histidyl-tRNA synthetase
VLERAAAYVRGADMEAALTDQRVVRAAVGNYGHSGRLLFDLGIFRNFDYYTGMVFEVYAPGLGFTLGGGGRYDSLLAAYGAPMPAVGLGLGLDRVHVALVEQGSPPVADEPTVLVVGGLDTHVAAADTLRAACVGVFALPLATSSDSLVRLAHQKSIPILVEPVDGTGGSRWTVTDIRGAGVTETCSATDLPAVVCHAAFEHEGTLERGRD